MRAISSGRDGANPVSNVNTKIMHLKHSRFTTDRANTELHLAVLHYLGCRVLPPRKHVALKPKTLFASNRHLIASTVAKSSCFRTGLLAG